MDGYAAGRLHSLQIMMRHIGYLASSAGSPVRTAIAVDGTLLLDLGRIVLEKCTAVTFFPPIPGEEGFRNEDIPFAGPKKQVTPCGCASTL
jgi:hypothetical protein